SSALLGLLPSVISGFEISPLTIDESPYILTEGTVCNTIACITLKPLDFRSSKYASASSRSNLLNINHPVSPNQKKGFPSSVIKYLPFSLIFNAGVGDVFLDASQLISAPIARVE